MSSKPSPSRYARPVRLMHWTVFGFVLLAYVLINLFDLFPRGSATRANILAAHFLAGIAVLLLVVPRLTARMKYDDPPILPPPDRLTEMLAKVTHALLYLFLLVQPILGIVTLQVAGKPISLFGVTVLPAFFGPGNRELGHQWENIHSWVGTIFYYVIGLHILAALWHHYRRRDNTLRRML